MLNGENISFCHSGSKHSILGARVVFCKHVIDKNYDINSKSTHLMQRH